MGVKRFFSGGAAHTSNRDDWETPSDLFAYLNSVKGYTLDPCSTHENAKCERHFTKEDDGLSKSWEGERVFCNPPYGRDIGSWAKKCAEESKHADITLLCAARTDTRWFADYVVPYARVVFIKGRLRYELGGVPLQSSPFPSMLAFFGGARTCLSWTR